MESQIKPVIIISDFDIRFRFVLCHTCTQKWPKITFLEKRFFPRIDTMLLYIEKLKSQVFDCFLEINFRNI